MSFQEMRDSEPSGADLGMANDRGLMLRCADCKGARVFRNEFSKKNLWMTGDTSYGRLNWIKAFGASRFSKFTGIPFVVYRFILACYGLFVFIWSIVTEESDGDAFHFGYWMYFLTHWMITVNMLTLLLLFVSTAMAQLKYGENSDIWKTRNPPHYIRAAWVTKLISLPGGLFVVLLYWLLLKGGNDPLSSLSHGGLWAVIVFDHLFIGLQPFLFVQCVWVLIFGLAYGFWTVIFNWADLVNKDGNPWIYDPIKWRTAPASAAFWAFGSPFIVLVPMYWLFWSFNFFRRQPFYRIAEAESSKTSALSTGGPIIQDKV